jgi:hypothetical protein
MLQQLRENNCWSWTHHIHLGGADEQTQNMYLVFNVLKYSGIILHFRLDKSSTIVYIWIAINCFKSTPIVYVMYGCWCETTNSQYTQEICHTNHKIYTNKIWSLKFEEN